MSNIILISKEELVQLLEKSLKAVLREESSLNVNQDAKELLDLQEAAEFLKLKIHTIYGYTSQKQIPFIKKGKKLYFEKSKLEAWLLEGSKESISDIRKRLNGNNDVI